MLNGYRIIDADALTPIPTTTLIQQPLFIVLSTNIVFKTYASHHNTATTQQKN